MKTYKEKTVKTVDNIYCDSCGQSTKQFEDSDPDFATLEACWGYGSKYDGTQYEIHLCEDCFTDILDSIKKTRNYLLGPFKYPYKEDPLSGKNYL